MPAYQYDKSSLIDEVTIITNETGGTRAYLHAKPNATPEELGEAMKGLLDRGYLSVPYEYKGKSVLEIRGFGKEDALLDSLKQQNLTSGTSQKKEVAEDKISFFKKLSKKSLIVSALLYLVGDAAYIKYEKVDNVIKAKEHEEKLGEINKIRKNRGESLLADEAKPSSPWDWLAGYGYLAGSTSSLAAMLLQKDPSEQEIQKASKTFLQAAQAAGIEIDTDTALSRTANTKDDSGVIRKTFTKYPAELMNLSFATAGLAIARKSHYGLKDLKREEELYPELGLADNKKHLTEKSVAKKDVVLGLGTMASGIVSSFVKETPLDPDKPRKKGIAGVGEFLKEKPLRIAGYGYLISTVIHLVSSIQERQGIVAHNKETGENKPVNHTTFRLIFVITNLIAEVIMSLSSKGHGSGVKTDDSIDPVSYTHLTLPTICSV